MNPLLFPPTLIKRALDEDVRAVRDSVGDLEPPIRELNDRVETMCKDLTPLGELADKIPGIG